MATKGIKSSKQNSRKYFSKKYLMALAVGMAAAVGGTLSSAAARAGVFHWSGSNSWGKGTASDWGASSRGAVNNWSNSSNSIFDALPTAPATTITMNHSDTSTIQDYFTGSFIAALGNTGPNITKADAGNSVTLGSNIILAITDMENTNTYTPPHTSGMANTSTGDVTGAKNLNPQAANNNALIANYAAATDLKNMQRQSYSVYDVVKAIYGNSSNLKYMTPQNNTGNAVSSIDGSATGIKNPAPQNMTQVTATNYNLINLTPQNSINATVSGGPIDLKNQPLNQPLPNDSINIPALINAAQPVTFVTKVTPHDNASDAADVTLSGGQTDSNNVTQSDAPANDASITSSGTGINNATAKNNTSHAADVTLSGTSIAGKDLAVNSATVLNHTIFLASAASVCPGGLADPWFDCASPGNTGIWDANTNNNWSSTNPSPSYTQTWGTATLANGDSTGGSNSLATFQGTAGTVTVSGAVSVGAITFATDGYTLGGSGTLTFGSTMTLGSTVTTSGGTDTINTILAGSLGLTKAGAGTLILGGGTSNTYTGNTTVGQGVLTLSKTGGVVAIAGGTLALNSTANQAEVVMTQSNQFGSGVVLDFTGATTNQRFSLMGTNQTLAGIVSPNTFAFIQNGSLAGGVGPANATLTLNGSGNYTYTGNIRNNDNGSNAVTVSLVMAGTGTQTLGGTGIGYTGGTTISSGTLREDFSTRSANTQFTLGTIAVGSSGTFELFTNTTFGTYQGALPINTTITGSGTITKTGAGIVDFFTGTSLANFSGVIDVQAGTLADQSGSFTTGLENLQVEGGAFFDLRTSDVKVNNLTGSGTLGSSFQTHLLTVGAQNGSSTFNGIITNNGIPNASGNSQIISLTKVGNGTLTLTGTNTYTGGTTINGGVLSVGLIADSVASNIGLSGTLNFGGGTLTFTGTSGASTRAIAFNSGGGTVNVNAGGSLALTGTWSGNGGVTKVGSGTLTIGNTNGSDRFEIGSANGGNFTMAAGVLNINPSNYIVFADNGVNSSFTQTGGTVNANDPTGTYLTNAATGTATLSISGGTFNQGATPMYVGVNGATGIINISGTGVLNDTNQVILGYNTSGSTGTLSLSGSGTLNVSGNYLIVGNSGAGTYNQTGGTANIAASAYVGNGAGSTGTMNISAGSFTQSVGTFYVGVSGAGTVTLSGTGSMALNQLDIYGNGQTGTFNMTGGTLTVNSSNTAFVGSTGAGTSTFNQSGGTTILSAATIVSNGTGAGTVNVSGGTFLDTAGIFYVGVVNTTGQVATLNVSGTSFVSLNQLNLGYQAGVTSVVNLNGGTLRLFNETGGNGGAASLGTSTFNFNGGTLQAGASFTAPTAVSTVVNSSGAIIDTQNFNVTMPTALTAGTGSGGLTKYGAGSLILNSTIGSTYTGATTLNGGTLLLDFTGMTTPTNLLSSSSALNINNGSTLSVKGKATGTTSQTLGNMAVNNGGGIIVLTPNGGTATTLTLGNTWTQSNNSTLLIDESAAATSTLTSSPTYSGNFMPWVTVKTTTAFGFGTVVGGNVVPYTAYTDPLPASGASSSTDYGLAGGTALLASQTITASETANSLTIAPTAGSLSLTINNGQVLSFTTGAVAFDGSTQAYSITGLGQFGGSNATLTLSTFGTNALTISAPIGGGSGKLVLGGSGKTIINGNNTYTGGTQLNSGTLSVGTNTALGSGTLTINGGTIDASSAALTLANNPQVWNGNFAFTGTNALNMGTGGDAGTIPSSSPETPALLP